MMFIDYDLPKVKNGPSSAGIRMDSEIRAFAKTLARTQSDMAIYDTIFDRFYDKFMQAGLTELDLAHAIEQVVKRRKQQNDDDTMENAGVVIVRDREEKLAQLSKKQNSDGISNADSEDYEVVYTDRNYQTIRKVFKSDPSGKAARQYAKKLEDDDAKDKYGNIRGPVNVRLVKNDHLSNSAPAHTFSLARGQAGYGTIEHTLPPMDRVENTDKGFSRSDTGDAQSNSAESDLDKQMEALEDVEDGMGSPPKPGSKNYSKYMELKKKRDALAAKRKPTPEQEKASLDKWHRATKAAGEFLKKTHNSENAPSHTFSLARGQAGYGK
jgi:hypothetical protein